MKARDNLISSQHFKGDQPKSPKDMDVLSIFSAMPIIYQNGMSIRPDTTGTSVERTLVSALVKVPLRGEAIDAWAW
ncbi:hypothetical protein N7471_001461 [Penicillium samsonianum]|uniref:uncharacterized protein n=1 Tax=Penicillium samsonianum TaxID=1882272 RepID=UPI002547D3DE|nr:uncharacterized protein N7471_001461 [Penicillium samsonianum]KAJ6150262.1 hypothetical protein N7471_001461 [Penicillium samsonianum]